MNIPHTTAVAMAFAISLITAPAAQASPMTELHQSICRYFNAVGANGKSIVTTGKTLVEAGFTEFEAGQQIAEAVATYCPQYLPALKMWVTEVSNHTAAI